MSRDWDELERRHAGFWECADTDRPLVTVNVDYTPDPVRTASLFGDGELIPDRIDASMILGDFAPMVEAHERIGDDYIVTGDPFVGIPWLEAMCGCPVEVPDGRSLWPATVPGAPVLPDPGSLPGNPWFQKLRQVLEALVVFAGDELPVSMTHLRGPADILAAVFGTQELFLMMVDDPDRVRALAMEASELHRRVARMEAGLIRPYRGGYCLRQFGLWSPQPSLWLQDDTSGMISAERYREVFLEAFADGAASAPFGVLHLHIPSLHLAPMLAEVQNVRAINVYFDDNRTTVRKALPVFAALQARRMPLVIAKDIYRGFSLGEYAEILELLSPAGLAVHLGADSVDEGATVAAEARKLAATGPKGPP